MTNQPIETIQSIDLTLGDRRTIYGSPIAVYLTSGRDGTARLDYLAGGTRHQVLLTHPGYRPEVGLDGPTTFVMPPNGYDHVGRVMNPEAPMYLMALDLDAWDAQQKAEELQARMRGQLEEALRARSAGIPLSRALHDLSSFGVTPEQVAEADGPVAVGTWPGEQEYESLLRLKSVSPLGPVPFTVTVRASSPALGPDGVIPKGARLQLIAAGPEEGFYGPVHDPVGPGVVETVEEGRIEDPSQNALAVPVVEITP